MAAILNIISLYLNVTAAFFNMENCVPRRDFVFLQILKFQINSLSFVSYAHFFDKLALSCIIIVYKLT